MAKRPPAKKSASPKTPKPKPFKEAAEKAGIVERKTRAKPDIIEGRGVDTMNGQKVTTRDQVVRLATGLSSLRKDSRSTSDAIRDMLTKAEETKHLNKKAFMLAFRLHQMSDMQLARDWDVFLKYCDDLGIPDRATAQGDLLKQTQADNDELAGQTDIEDAAERDPGQEAKDAADGLSPGRRRAGHLRVMPGGAPAAAAAPDK